MLMHYCPKCKVWYHETCLERSATFESPEEMLIIMSLDEDITNSCSLDSLILSHFPIIRGGPYGMVSSGYEQVKARNRMAGVGGCSETPEDKQGSEDKQSKAVQAIRAAVSKVGSFECFVCICGAEWL